MIFPSCHQLFSLTWGAFIKQFGTSYNIFLKIAECDNRMYGVNCSEECGTCINNEVCHHINGSCLKGCDKGFYGQRCDQSNLRDHF